MIQFLFWTLDYKHCSFSRKCLDAKYFYAVSRLFHRIHLVFHQNCPVFQLIQTSWTENTISCSCFILGTNQVEFVCSLPFSEIRSSFLHLLRRGMVHWSFLGPGRSLLFQLNCINSCIGYSLEWNQLYIPLMNRRKSSYWSDNFQLKVTNLGFFVSS